MAKRGPKPIQIDWEQVDKLAGIMCTAEEIAEVLKVGYNTLERRCKTDHKMNIGDYLTIKRNAGKASLRRAQFKRAIDGNTAMLIWLGKQYLGQTDKMQNDGTFTVKNLHEALAKIIDDE